MPQIIPPLVNGESYAWAQIVCTIAGVPVVGITEITYKEKQEKKNNYGAGNRPVSRGYGKKEPEASITLYLEELEAIRKATPTGSILDIAPFAINVTFIPSNGAGTITHVLNNAEFLEDPVETKEGDTEVMCKLPLIISHITKR